MTPEQRFIAADPGGHTLTERYLRESGPLVASEQYGALRFVLNQRNEIVLKCSHLPIGMVKALAEAANKYLAGSDPEADRYRDALKDIYNLASFDWATMPEHLRKGLRDVILELVNQALSGADETPEK